MVAFNSSVLNKTSVFVPMSKCDAMNCSLSFCTTEFINKRCMLNVFVEDIDDCLLENKVYSM